MSAKRPHNWGPTLHGLFESYYQCVDCGMIECWHGKFTVYLMPTDGVEISRGVANRNGGRRTPDCPKTDLRVEKK